ncbi:MAG: hypothetical protein M3R53_05650 [Candidatus Eremiobacteraeota bacterium]|nr:hypothetical protein [Candidatus Eremiobacteraeota bacterium]
MIAFIAATVLAMGTLDAKFCPEAPSPDLYQQNANYLILGPSGKFDVPSSFEVAGRLVDTRSEKLVGWLYLDEHATISVALIPHVDRKIYAAFGMAGHNWHRPDYPTEAIIQPNFRMPKGIEVRSCTQPSG